jgi:hypothetical protein
MVPAVWCRHLFNKVLRDYDKLMGPKMERQVGGFIELDTQVPWYPAAASGK